MGTFSKLLPQESLPKWQVALLVSIPVAVGLGYLYYRFNVSTKELIVVNKVSKEKGSAKGSTETKEEIEVVSNFFHVLSCRY